MPVTIEWDFHRSAEAGGHGVLKEGKAPAAPPGRLPRVAKLMALALRFEELLRSGQVKDQAELARLGQVTRARMTQVMTVRLLAPDIQEALLFLPRVERGRDPLRMHELQAIALKLDWTRQRRAWRRLHDLA